MIMSTFQRFGYTQASLVYTSGDTHQRRAMCRTNNLPASTFDEQLGSAVTDGFISGVNDMHNHILSDNVVVDLNDILLENGTGKQGFCNPFTIEYSTSDVLDNLRFPTQPILSHTLSRRSVPTLLECHADTTDGHTSSISQTVRVESSFVVAEIIGKQGVRIKKIRASTNTWIRTPSRGEDPVFVITGRKEGVEQAKADILAAAERVINLRAARTQCSTTGSSMRPYQPADESSVQAKVSVPASLIGHVIGPKGFRIKQIANQTGTYIKTPGKHKTPTFELFGAPENVEEAKGMINALVVEYINDDQFKSYMQKLPIHEPGSPISLPSTTAPTAAAAHCIPVETTPILNTDSLIQRLINHQSATSSTQYTRLRPTLPRRHPTSSGAQIHATHLGSKSFSTRPPQCHH